MSEPVVQTAGLTKRYGPRIAVDEVNLTVRRGEVYGFLGPNGAGKTTTLRMVLGLIRPTSGTVSVLDGAAGSPGVMARVGALVEGPGFMPYLSGRDNLRVLARYRRLAEAEVEDALERVELGERGGDVFRSYSLGMKQRLGVAAALLGDPELIVLDEPTNGLDPAGMAGMRSLVVDLARGGQTVLLSSHLLGEVQEICHRVGVINRGRLLRESTVAELLGTPRLQVRAEPVEEALAVAREFTGDVLVERGELLVALAPEQAPQLVRALVARGLEVHSVRRSDRSLEDVFFEMTAAGAVVRREETVS
ncbi:ABC transporter ATP-binding protein [Ornithinimicrobium murale]|uniref:ABC transporter ATP-binding protein n=1 Tax=Ornithinimicrobium murale TaxID=1050153 RepID=UPI000E0D92F4|nr:ABC transporter ATP-binding protein [Ornithinimicrobium murale]